MRYINKIIGDCYVVASGLVPSSDYESGAVNCVKAGIAMIKELEPVVASNTELIGDTMLQVRIGIHTSHSGTTAAPMICLGRMLQ